MDVLKYLEDYEKKVVDSINEAKKIEKAKGGKTSGKFSSPSAEVKNPVKTNMTGQKPKGGSASKTIKKVSPEIKNNTKTNMKGQKNPSPGNKFKNVNSDMGGGIKTGSPGKKPAGAGKNLKTNFNSPSPEVKNTVKNVKGSKLHEHASSILDGDDCYINERVLQPQERKVDEVSRETITNRATSLLD